jgi:site-specific DNA recombinase
MTKDQIATIVAELSDLFAVIRHSDPADKAEIYARLGLRLTYKPQNRTIRAEAHIGTDSHWQFDSVRGAHATNCL